MALAFKNLTGDLFAGEAKLFFPGASRQTRIPFRLETSPLSRFDCEPLSLHVHVINSGMVLMCDSRMNATRVAKTLCASDIGVDHSVPAHDPDNAGRWTNIRETSDGRHWSDGEYSVGKHSERRNMHTICRSKGIVVSGAADLIAKLPPFASDAVRDGRAIVISRLPDLNNSGKRRRGSKSFAANKTVSGGLHATRLCKSFGVHVFALNYDVSADIDKQSPTSDPVAILIVGKCWPKETSCSTTVDAVLHRPLLTVVRRRRRNATKGGRVFCLCLGNYLANSLAGLSVEEIARLRRHYEGYFNDIDCASWSA